MNKMNLVNPTKRINCANAFLVCLLICFCLVLFAFNCEAANTRGGNDTANPREYWANIDTDDAGGYYTTEINPYKLWKNNGQYPEFVVEGAAGATIVSLLFKSSTAPVQATWTVYTTTYLAGDTKRIEQMVPGMLWKIGVANGEFAQDVVVRIKW